MWSGGFCIEMYNIIFLWFLAMMEEKSYDAPLYFLSTLNSLSPETHTIITNDQNDMFLIINCGQ